MTAFLDNKYFLWYSNIINNARCRTINNAHYYERHHIVPKSLGGTNDRENIVSLTAKEHFICHLLLTKFTIGNAKKKMYHAAWRMMSSSNNQLRYAPNSNTYSILRKHRKQSAETKQKIRNSSLGKTRTPPSTETRAKLSAALKGKPSGRIYTTEMREKLSLAHKSKTPTQKQLDARAARKLTCSCIFCKQETVVNSIYTNHKKCC